MMGASGSWKEGGMTSDAADRVENLRQRFDALADDDAVALGQVEWQARQLIQRHGNDVEARALHIAILARLGRRAEAIEALDAALPLLPWSTTPLTALRLAGSAVGFGRAAQAAGLVRRVLGRRGQLPAPAMPLLALIPLVAGEAGLLAEIAERVNKKDPAAAPVLVHTMLGHAELADHQRIVLARVGAELCEVRIGIDRAGEEPMVTIDYRLTIDPADRPPTVVPLAATALSPRLVERFGQVAALAHLPQNEG
jgi:hypothetical protein